MGHAEELDTFLEMALQEYNPYVKVGENIIPNIPTNVNRVYADQPKIIEPNAYLNSYKERWRLRIDTSTKPNLENMTHSLLEAVKNFNRRTINYYFRYSDKTDVSIVNQKMVDLVANQYIEQISESGAGEGQLGSSYAVRLD